jgi:hypothetical protein
MPFHFIKGVYGGVTLSISKCRVLECRVLQATKKISLSISTGVLEFFTALFRIESLFIPPFFTHAILLGRTAELMRLICFDPLVFLWFPIPMRGCPRRFGLVSILGTAVSVFLVQ